MKVNRAKATWVGRRVLIAVFGTYVAYLLIINLLLLTGLGQKILNAAEPEHVRLEWASAYSLWFMRVHTTGFAVRGEDSAVEWRITADEASTGFGFTDFLDRRLRMFDTKAKGVSVRIRFKVAAPTADYLAALPPIEGLPNPPLKGPPVPELTDENYNLWSAELDDVVADDVREVWVDTLHYTDKGGIHVAGGLYFKPLRAIRLDPTEITMARGAVDVGPKRLADDIHGEVRAAIAEFDPRVPNGTEVFRNIDCRIVGKARLTDLVWIDSLTAPVLAFTGGGGPVEVSAQLRAGVLEHGSRADMRFDGWTAWLGRTWSSGTSIAHARVGRAMTVALESYGVSVHHDTTSVLGADLIGVVVTLANTDLAAPLHPWSAHVDMPSGRVADLKSLDGYLGTEAPFYAGSAVFALHGDARANNASGTLVSTLAGVSMQAGKALVHGGGKIDLTLKSYDFDKSKATLSLARFDLHDLQTGDQTGYWINGTASPCEIGVGSGEVSMVVAGKARDAQLPLALMAAPGIVVGLVGKQGFTFSARLHEKANELAVSDVRLIGDTVEVTAHYRSAPSGKSGAALVTTSGSNVGIEVRKDGMFLRPFASQSWYASTSATK